MLNLIPRAVARLRRPGHAEAGYTLIELLVVLVILGIIGTIVTSTIVNSMQATRREQDRVFTVATAQTALERLSRDVRTADPLVAANLNDVTMLVYRDGHCQQRHWWVDANSNLNMSIAQWTAASTSCSTRSGGTDPLVTQVVMTNAGVDSTTLIFRYWSENVDNSLTEVTPPVPSNMLTRIDRVELSIKGLLRENGSPVLLTSSTDLRNVEQLP